MFVFFRIHYDSIKNRFFLCDYAEKLRTLWVVCETRVINNVQAVYCCRSIQWICLGNELQRTNGIFALSGRVDETNAKRSLSVSIFATKRKRKRTRAQRYCVNDFWKIVFGVFFFLFSTSVDGCKLASHSFEVHETCEYAFTGHIFRNNG